MKGLKDFEKELNKCSKCGLCQDSCPVFKLTKNECAVSKGKFIMLHGVAKGELKLSKNINRYLDMCTKCEKCKTSCPSGINVCEIFNIAKFEYMNKHFSSRIINFIQSKFIFDGVLKFFEYLTKPFRPQNLSSENPKTTVVYFKGCVNKVCPKTDIYLNKIFQNQGIKVIEPNFECCGLPFLSEGNLERFEQVAKNNITKLEGLDYNYFVTDCASCESTFLTYGKYLDIENPIHDGKSINWGDLIAVKGIKFKFKKTLNVTFHKPCHLKNDAFFKQILKNCENVIYKEMQDYDECCGLAGSFVLKTPKLSAQLMKQKAQNIINTNADCVITTCPACMAGLKTGLLLQGNSKIKVLSLLEFLSKADEIS